MYFLSHGSFIDFSFENSWSYLNFRAKIASLKKNQVFLSKLGAKNEIREQNSSINQFRALLHFWHENSNKA